MEKSQKKTRFDIIDRCGTNGDLQTGRLYTLLPLPSLIANRKQAN